MLRYDGFGRTAGQRGSIWLNLQGQEKFDESRLLVVGQVREGVPRHLCLTAMGQNGLGYQSGPAMVQEGRFRRKPHSFRVSHICLGMPS